MSQENEKIILDDGRVIYDSRSNAAATVILRYTNNYKTISILCIKRGKGSDEIGKWSIPCGYLNRNETLQECAIREFKEETSYDLDYPYVRENLNCVYFDDDPKSNKRQNLTFIFALQLFDSEAYKECDGLNKLTSYPIDIEFIKNNEVDEMKWVDVNDIEKYEWAYHCDEMLRKVLKYFNICK